MKKNIPQNHLEKLQAGEVASKNLMESLSIDISLLAKSIGITHKDCKEKGIVKQVKFYGEEMASWEKYQDHPSDLVRGMCAYSIAKKNLSLEDKMKLIQKFASDTHFGVREWSWMSMRPYIEKELENAIEIMTLWSLNSCENIRRFSCEITRPRGVWCSHLNELKASPQMALQILENLKTDDSKYVKLSVGNWLNDAFKSKPDWVEKICGQWLELKNVHTNFIVKRGLRSKQ